VPYALSIATPPRLEGGSIFTNNDDGWRPQDAHAAGIEIAAVVTRAPVPGGHRARPQLRRLASHMFTAAGWRRASIIDAGGAGKIDATRWRVGRMGSACISPVIWRLSDLERQRGIRPKPPGMRVAGGDGT
jgi:hypothetical protein